MDVAGSGLLEITAEYEAFRLGREVDGALYREADAQWFRAILAGVVENQKLIDPVIRQSLTEDWPLSRLDSTLRAILRAGVYELIERGDVPVAVIVTEYVDIAKAFYEDEEPKLVNAVLDRVSRRVRGEGRGGTPPRERGDGRAGGAPLGADPGRRAGHRRLGRADLHLHRRAWPATPARRRQVAGHRAGDRVQPRRGARRAACRRLIRALGQRSGFMTGTLVTAKRRRRSAPWRCSAAISGCLRWR